MNDKQIQDELTVEGWGRWKRYVKWAGVKKIADEWPNYDYHEFIKLIDAQEKEDEVKRKGECGIKGDKCLVSTNLVEDTSDREQLELYTHDHVSQRRDTPSGQLPLQEPSNGPARDGLTGEPQTGI